MRIVVLAPSPYSETACATAVRLARIGYIPTGALALSTLDHRTLLRKIAQWGVRDVARYARTKLTPPASDGQSKLHNPYLQSFLQHGSGVFRSLREVASFHGFPLLTCHDQNTPDSIERLRQWSPDLLIFTGGNILRKQLLAAPRLGVLNVHLGLLPQIRGMSSPEWSLLTRVPVGITIHYMDAGIDTGPVLQRYEYPDLAQCESLSDLRHRLISFGIEKIGEVVAALDQRTIIPTPQTDHDNDHQFFVMHEWLQSRAAQRLAKNRMREVAGILHG